MSLPTENKEKFNTIKDSLANLIVDYSNSFLLWLSVNTQSHYQYLQSNLKNDPNLTQLKARLDWYDRHPWLRFFAQLFSSLNRQRALVCLHELNLLHTDLNTLGSNASLEQIKSLRSRVELLQNQAPQLSYRSRLRRPLLDWLKQFSSDLQQTFAASASSATNPSATPPAALPKAAISAVTENKAEVAKPAYDYPLLELNRGATPEQVKKAYRTAVFKYHQDRPGGSKEAFQSYSLSPSERSAIEQDYVLRNALLRFSLLLTGRAISIMDSYTAPLSRLGHILSFEEVDLLIRSEAEKIIEETEEKYRKCLVEQRARWVDGELISGGFSYGGYWGKQANFSNAINRAIQNFRQELQKAISPLLHLDSGYKLNEYAPHNPPFTEKQKQTLEEGKTIQYGAQSRLQDTAREELARIPAAINLNTRLELTRDTPEISQNSQSQQDALFKWYAIDAFLTERTALLTRYQNAQRVIGEQTQAEIDFARFLRSGVEGARSPSPLCQARTATELHRQFYLFLKVLSLGQHDSLDDLIKSSDIELSQSSEGPFRSRLFVGILKDTPEYKAAKEQLHSAFLLKAKEVLAAFLRDVKTWNLAKLDADAHYRKLFIRNQLASLKQENDTLAQEKDLLDKYYRIHANELQTNLAINDFELQKQRLAIMLPDAIAAINKLPIPPANRPETHSSSIPSEG
ncbi:MAG TPA: hypothetical protein VD770_04585, partial [Coxiellaceae bacterium]|nr:hypothetical protein [Coxiellaceae bacterium]